MGQVLEGHSNFPVDANIERCDDNLSSDGHTWMIQELGNMPDIQMTVICQV
jgi:hypothetical protein